MVVRSLLTTRLCFLRPGEFIHRPTARGAWEAGPASGTWEQKMDRERIFASTLATLQVAFPQRASVPVSVGAPAVSISHKTFRNRFAGGAGAPFPTFKVGNKRHVALVVLADYVTRMSLGEQVDKLEPRAGGPVRPTKRAGRPSRGEERRAALAGLTVTQLRERDARAGGSE